MTKNSIITAKILTYSGTLPLIASVISVFFPFEGLNPVFVATTYSAIIISFLCGIHWAAYIFFADKCPRYLLITSNVVALLAWLSLLLMPQATTTILQALCFLYLLTLDSKIRNAGMYPGWFYTLRRNATIIVVLCLFILAGFS
jgi:hypothetical protein